MRRALLALVLVAGCGKEPPPVTVPAGPTGSVEGTVVDPGGRPVFGAFVYVDAGLEAWRYPVPAEPVVLDQKNYTFEPHVFGIRIGQPLRITSSDPSHHNVNARPGRGDGFNVSLYAGETITKRFTAREVMVTLKCDLHPNMIAYAGVLEHPFFAVTGPDGSFELRGLPLGRYRLGVWHEVRGPLASDFSIQSSGTTRLPLAYP